MKKNCKHICLALVCVLLLSCFCGCGNKIPEKVPNNIFSEFVYVKDGILHPRNVTYGQTIEAFKEERGIAEEDILTSRDHVIVIPYTAEQFPYEIREAITYKPDRSFKSESDKHEIMMVQYIIPINKADAPKLFADLYEQAKEVMPAPSTQNLGFENTIENIKDGNTVYWVDDDLNTFIFGVTSNVYGEPDMMVVNFTMRSGMYPTMAQKANADTSGQ